MQTNQENKREDWNYQIRNEKRDHYLPWRNLKIIREYYKQLYFNNLDNSNKMNKFLEKHKLPKLSQEGINSLNRKNNM